MVMHTYTLLSLTMKINLFAVSFLHSMIYRLSKHHSQNVLSGHMTGGRGHDLSLARQMLVFILHKGKKDEDLLQVIIVSFFFFVHFL